MQEQDSRELQSLHLLNVRELAEMLRVSRRTIETWVRQKRIPYVKLGTVGRSSLVRFRLESINAWIDAQEVKPEDK